ncbi:Helicase loader DnaI [uncultured Gammaproteobacteria bacterium]|nr:Helicase loader DnaI [uncultured Gammaproteobacteria bacterium]
MQITTYGLTNNIMLIVTDYRLNANHNIVLMDINLLAIVTDYRLNANHNLKCFNVLLL